MDGLTNRQRATGWLATWNPSFIGKAIVNKNFEYMAVNDQFCEILGVTPADVLEHKFTDITPEPERDLDKRNAEMVIKGLSPGYLLPKTFELPDGHRVKVLLMKVGVRKESGEFDFFVARIVDAPQLVSTESNSERSWTWLSWTTKAWKMLTVLVPGMAWVIYEVIKLLRDGENITSLPLP